MKFLERLTPYLSSKEIEALGLAIQQTPYKGLRINTLKLSKDFILSRYSFLNPHPFVKDAFIYQEDEASFGKLAYHLQGLYYIQEPSAMMVAHLLNPTSNDKVIDLAAAPGGKTTHAISLMENKGLLIANDVSYNRALELSKNVERMGAKNAVVTSSNVKDFLPSFTGYFDKVILDAPCSGEGMFRKNIKALDDWSVEKVCRLAKNQKELIMDAYKLLKYQGVMIYSTCTFEKDENEDVINYLLENTNASLISIPQMEMIDRGIEMKEAIRIYPSKFQGEGHFMALIQCNDEHQKQIKDFKRINEKNSLLNLFFDFAKENLNISLEGEYRLLKDELYLSPLNLNLKGLSVIRDGLHLGTITNNRFIPSFALALYLKKDEVKKTVNLKSSDKKASAFLKGETISEELENGYVLVLIDDQPLSWGKVSNNIVKNLLPKGLRNTII